MKITIFLVDDHPIVLDGLRSTLETEPDLIVIGLAENGLKAIEQVARTCPAIVIMDITMPGLNGIEAMRQIKDICPQTRVIILTMHGATQHILRALQAGAAGYLLKESASIEVVKAVRTVYAGQRYLSQKIPTETIDQYLRQSAAGNQIEAPLAQLSQREREVLHLVVEGKSSAEIAEALSLSINTVKTYRSRFMRKLNLDDLPSLVKFAIQHDLTPPE